MKTIRLTIFLLALVCAFGSRAQTLTLNLVMSLDDWGASEPSTAYPAFFTKTLNDVYTFTGTELVIADGGEVTITGITLLFDEGVKIVVNPGGRLIMNACTMKGKGSLANNEFWGGIEVKGTALEAQYYTLPFPWVADPNDMGTLNILDFGIVDLISGTRIIGAEYGIYSNTGGIVRTSNAHFEDCLISVLLTYYEHTYATPSSGNISEINACKFVETSFKRKTDKDYVNIANYAFCLLSEVKGINFHGCSFENTIPKSVNYPGDCQERGIGIVAEASSFKLQNNGTGSINPVSGCIKYNGMIPCTFSNLYAGIYSSIALGAPYNSYVLGVEDAVFQSCLYGAVISGGDHHVFSSCLFNMGNLTNYFNNLNNTGCYNWGPRTGLAMIKAREFIVTNCNFTVNDNDGNTATFISLSDVGKFSSFIYKNIFTNNCTTCTKGLNPITSISGIYFRDGSNQGVEIRCNQFNSLHFSMVFDDCEVPDVFSGATGTTSTGNKFFGSDNEIWDEQTNTVTYLYNPFDPAELATPVNNGQSNNHSVTFTITTGTETSCSGWDCKGWPVSNEQIQDLNIAVFPNPAKDRLNIHLGENVLTEEYSIQVMDAMGKIIDITYSKEEDQFVLDVSSLSIGMYLVRLQVGESVHIARFVKE